MILQQELIIFYKPVMAVCVHVWLIQKFFCWQCVSLSVCGCDIVVVMSFCKPVLVGESIFSSEGDCEQLASKAGANSSRSISTTELLKHAERCASSCWWLFHTLAIILVLFQKDVRCIAI